MGHKWQKGEQYIHSSPFAQLQGFAREKMAVSGDSRERMHCDRATLTCLFVTCQRSLVHAVDQVVFSFFFSLTPFSTDANRRCIDSSRCRQAPHLYSFQGCSTRSARHGALCPTRGVFREASCYHSSGALDIPTPLLSSCFHVEGNNLGIPRNVHPSWLSGGT